MVVIDSERLIIRNFRETDAPGLWEYMRDPKPNCFKPDALESLAQAQVEVARRIDDDQTLAVCLRETGQLIGELCSLKEEPDTYSLCWHFNDAYQGLGYATEAAEALLDELFNGRGARRVFAYVEEDNIKSQKLCLRLGMRLEGRFVEFISFVNNSDGSPKYENTLQYALLAKEWDEFNT
jgi:RimJ/RimL family protein N-acetyltransferase